MEVPVLVAVKGKRVGVPRKPVIWFGEIWVAVPAEGGKTEYDTRSWRANKPITRQQAQSVLHQLREQLIGEHGSELPFDSGFWMQSR